MPPPAPAVVTSATAAAPVSDPRQTFVAAALSMRGRPYRYGGADPAGFDCSGLVDYAARSAGLKVPRTTAEQLRAGVPVKRGALEAGDLVFMRLDKGLHVGIVTEPGVFVHAPSTGGQVRLDRLDAPPYRKGFIGGRRIGGRRTGP